MNADDPLDDLSGEILEGKLEAFQWLGRAHALRDSGLSDAKVSPRLRSLHGDPRWEAFLKKVGFGE